MGNYNSKINRLKQRALLDKIDLIISQLQDRLSVQRFRPNEADNIKLEYTQVILQAIQIENEILRDLLEQDVFLDEYEPASDEPKKSLFDFK